MQVKIYSATHQKTGLRKLMGSMWHDLLSSRDLAWRLAVRDTKGLYRQSFLGVLWAFFTPLMNTLVWIFMNRTGVVNIPDAGIPYPVYVFTGTMLWSVLLESMTAPLQQTQASQGIMTKINFPKEALILSGVYKIIFNTGIKLVLILAAMLFMGVVPDEHLLLFPLALISMIICGTVAGMFLTPVGMLYTDIGKALPLLMQFLMYFSPVVYVAPKTGMLASIIKWNPITPLITTARNWLTGMPADNIQYFLLINAAVLLLLFFAWVLYRISIPIIVERMTS